MFDDDRLGRTHSKDIRRQLPYLILNCAHVLIEGTTIAAGVPRHVYLRDEPGIDLLHPLNWIEPLIDGVHQQGGNVQQQTAMGLFAHVIQKVGLAHRRVSLNRRRNGFEKQHLLAHVHHFDGVIHNRIQACPAEADG
jgi:hypothetical protein